MTTRPFTALVLAGRRGGEELGHQNACFGRLVHQTLAHKRETDETEMLKLGLREYIDEHDLLGFVEGMSNIWRIELSQDLIICSVRI